MKCKYNWVVSLVWRSQKISYPQMEAIHSSPTSELVTQIVSACLRTSKNESYVWAFVSFLLYILTSSRMITDPGAGLNTLFSRFQLFLTFCLAFFMNNGWWNSKKWRKKLFFRLSILWYAKSSSHLLGCQLLGAS
jgi:hypothetical protein